MTKLLALIALLIAIAACGHGGGNASVHGEEARSGASDAALTVDASAATTANVTTTPPAATDVITPPPARLMRFEGIKSATSTEAPIIWPVLSSQPVKVTPSAVCEDATIILEPAPETPFPDTQGGNAVHFSPCGVFGKVVTWSRLQIKVRVPAAAESGPVWIARTDGVLSQRFNDGANCLGRTNGRSIFGGGFDCVAPQLSPVRPMPTLTFPGIPFQLASRPSVRGLPSGFARTCGMRDITGTGGVDFTSPSPAIRIDDQLGLGHGCFGACRGASHLITGKVVNHLTVTHRPRIKRLLPRDAIKVATNTYRVERGPVDLQWEVTSDAANPDVSLTVDGNVVARGLDGTINVDVQRPVDGVLIARNDCGEVKPRPVVHLQPRATLALTPLRLVIAPGASATLTVSLPTPLTGDVHVLVCQAGTAGVTVQPDVVVIRAGQTSAVATISRAPGIASVNAGRQLAQINATPARPADEQVVSEAVESASVIGAPSDAPALVGMDAVRITGRLRYQKCFPLDASKRFNHPPVVDANGCETAPDWLPIRTADVEIWSTSGGPWGLELVTQTRDDGTFSIDRPLAGAKQYKVVVTAKNVAGQVNRKEDAGTYFWKEIGTPQVPTAAGTLRFDWDATGDEAAVFTGLNAILTGWRYVVARRRLSEEDGRRWLSRVAVIPAGTPRGMTLPNGRESYIWVGSRHELVDDHTMLHEYGHHLERMSGTYSAWASYHDGCYLTLDHVTCADRARAKACGATDNEPDGICWQNNEEHAWFEGFPTLFASLVARWDNGANLRLAGINDRGIANPSTCACGLLRQVDPRGAEINPAHRNRIGKTITARMVEGYIAHALFNVTASTSFVRDGAPVSGDELESNVLGIVFDDLKNTMPTFTQFKARWDARLPNNPQTAAILNPYDLN